MSAIFNDETIIMAKNLVIVESPAKAKTIQGFLGKDYEVKASFGHIRDLPAHAIGIDVMNDFEPMYEITEDKINVIKELQAKVDKAENIWLASDEDREGEAIAWHLYKALSLENKNTKRIVFHEITQQAILKAISNPRSIDLDLVNAQQARRVLDRLVGFELSPVLWKKLSGKPSNLSAGRVQSVAVRLIVQREHEINKFTSESAYKVVGVFHLDNNVLLKAELNQRFVTKQLAENFLNQCKGIDFCIDGVEKKDSKRTPAAPFTTSTLQQEASNKFGFSVLQTMIIAQKLYEAGNITYMRTDSVSLSETALAGIKTQIETAYGANYHQERKFANKNKNAQEAHEAIRPTYFDQPTIEGDAREVKLYELIWKRAVASQMADAKLENTTITIVNNNINPFFAAKGKVVVFDGFLKLYIETSDSEEEDKEDDKLLPIVKKGQVLSYKNIQAIEKFSSPPARYTEASLVKVLEEKGIGRPSTYAPTITTIMKREYVAKGEKSGKDRNYNLLTLSKTTIKEEILLEKTGSEQGKLVPTDVGNMVSKFLEDNFPEIVDYNFTAKVEKEFDEIAQGNKDWKGMIGAFYTPFHTEIEKVTEDRTREIAPSRLLGIHPSSGKNMYARMSRNGPLVQIGESVVLEEAERKELAKQKKELAKQKKAGKQIDIEENTDKKEKLQFASLKKNQSVDTITLEEALELFALPKSIGEYDGNEMIVAIGRFGPYIKHDSGFYSIPKEVDAYTLEAEEAISIIENKKLADANKHIQEYEHNGVVIKVLNGRFGPYITANKNNYKIPKGVDAALLTLEECITIINTPVAPAKSKYSKKK